jgi:hypothetical protein
MPRKKFDAITGRIHLVDNSTLLATGDTSYEKLNKVQWLIKHFSAVSKAQYK